MWPCSRVRAAAETSDLNTYVCVSLLTGAHTEELRALTWSHVDLTGVPDATPPVPPTVQLWRSVRAHGDTRTKLSRRTLRLPSRCVVALEAHLRAQAHQRELARTSWIDRDLVFCTRTGAPLTPATSGGLFGPSPNVPVWRLPLGPHASSDTVS
jgi:hypothetical protein